MRDKLILTKKQQNKDKKLSFLFCLPPRQGHRRRRKGVTPPGGEPLIKKCCHVEISRLFCCWFLETCFSLIYLSKVRAVIVLVKREGRIRGKLSCEVLAGAKRDAEEWHGAGDKS